MFSFICVVFLFTFLKIIFINGMCIFLYAHTHTCESSQAGQKKVSGPLDPELVIVSLLRMLGTELWSSERVASCASYWSFHRQ